MITMLLMFSAGMGVDIVKGKETDYIKSKQAVVTFISGKGNQAMEACKKAGFDCKYNFPGSTFFIVTWVDTITLRKALKQVGNNSAYIKYIEPDYPLTLEK